MGTTLPPAGPGHMLLVLTIAGLILCWLVVLLRLLTRKITKALGLDDLLMVIGLATWTLNSAAILGVTYHGAGRVLQDIPIPIIVTGIKYYFSAQILYAACTIPIRCSICCTLLRIADTKTVYRYILYGIMTLSGLSGSITIIAIALTCRPLQAFWGEAQGVCKSEITIKVGYFLSAVCISTDWSLAILPAIMLWNVRITRRVKIYVITILALGGLASCATIVRLRYLTKYGQPLKILYNAAYIAAWTVVEVGIGICAGSIGQIRPLLRHIPFFKDSGRAKSPDHIHNPRSRSGSVTLNAFPGHRRGKGSDATHPIHGRDELDLHSETDSQDERLHDPEGQMPASSGTVELTRSNTIRREFEVTVQPWVPEQDGVAVDLNTRRSQPNFHFGSAGLCRTEVWYRDPALPDDRPRMKSFGG